MPNTFSVSAEIFIAIKCLDKSYEFRKIEKVGKIMCPHALFSQARSQIEMLMKIAHYV